MVNNRIIALVDYKNRFGSKHFDSPYRSGMDKTLLSRLFAENGYELVFEYFHKVDLRDIERYQNTFVIYTSSEDIGYHYKSYIEDVVFGLQQIGAILIPDYKFLRANNNKVFMEFLRTTILHDDYFFSNHYGSLKDLIIDIENISFPAVFKTAEGASGTGVFLVKNKNELIAIIKKTKTYSYFKEDLRDYIRSLLHKGYQRESLYRNKFIIQPYIPDLKNDWKVYFFGNKAFVFNRPIQPGRGIKASGGGYDNYQYGEEAKTPKGFLEYCYNVFEKLNLPHASFDIAFDGINFYLIEFQALYFGTAGIPYSKGYFIKEKDQWLFKLSETSVEEAYVNSIIWFLNRHESFIHP